MLATALFFSCGPSAKEKAEKAKRDSIRVADSISAVNLLLKQKQQHVRDSIAVIEKAHQDSIVRAQAIADSITKAKPVKNAKPVKKADKKK